MTSNQWWVTYNKIYLSLVWIFVATLMHLRIPYSNNKNNRTKMNIILNLNLQKKMNTVKKWKRKKKKRSYKIMEKRKRKKRVSTLRKRWELLSILTQHSNLKGLRQLRLIIAQSALMSLRKGTWLKLSHASISFIVNALTTG